MQFSYVETKVKDLQATVQLKGQRPVVTKMSVNGEELRPSDRFWTSFFAKFGLSNNIFKYFQHAETFARVSEVAPNDKLIACIERDENGGNTLLGVASPDKARVEYEDLMSLLDEKGELPDGSAPIITYHNGLVQSTHAPRFANPTPIGPDLFHDRFVVETPIDGYGSPSIYLMLLRQVCTNGSIAMVPAFRTFIKLGKNEDDFSLPIVRALEGFNNEDGFSALRQRFEAAQHSWASISECMKLYKALVRVHSRGQIKVGGKVIQVGNDGAELMEHSPVITKFNNMIGGCTKAYGLADLNSLSAKRQRTLISPVTVYDLINFSSEVATHQATGGGDRDLQAYVGDLVGGGEEFDLEGTKDKFSDWTDFLVLDKKCAAAKATIDMLN